MTRLRCSMVMGMIVIAPAFTRGRRVRRGDRPDWSKSAATLSRVSVPVDVKYWLNWSGVNPIGSVEFPRLGAITGRSCRKSADGFEVLILWDIESLQSRLMARWCLLFDAGMATGNSKLLVLCFFIKNISKWLHSGDSGIPVTPSVLVVCFGF